MIDIEQRAVATYHKNFSYFSAQHPSLFRKIRILQSAIESGQYRENYSLEYINGYFDVKELASGGFLYGSDSAAHAKHAADGINLKKNESAIETLYNFPYTRTNIEDLDKLTIINSHLVGTAPIVQFVNEHTAGLNEMKKIYKFIFFGVGIGEHLKAIHEKIHADSYLIIEDNLELFRLSMFVTDYQELGAASTLFFSVMDAPGDFKVTYNLFAEDMLIRNSHLKFYLLSDTYAPKIKQIQNFAVTQSYLMYPYSYLLHKNLRVSRAIQKHYRFLNVLKPFENSPFADKPILYLAAGPSLSRHIEWVREHREQFVIVAVFMVSAKLEQAGIVPDIVIHVDEADTPVREMVDKLRDKEFLKNSLFILAASASLGLFETVADKEHIFLLEDRTRYKKEHGFIEFFSVGEVGYALSLLFGTHELYLLGLDLAVDQKTGQTHIDGHTTRDKVDLSKADSAPEQSGSLRETLLMVKGNKTPSVATTPLFDASLHKVNDYTKQYKKTDQQVFNLGDGAYFEEVHPREPDAVDTASRKALQKTSLRPLWREYLNAHATDRLSDEEKNNIIVRKKELRKKAKLIERFARQKIKNLEEFRKQLIKLIGELITSVTPVLNETSDIFLNYFMTVGGYIGNLMNTEGLNNAQTADSLHRVLSRQLYKILHAFGQFDFDYLNSDKYFNADRYNTLRNEILTLKLKANDSSQIDQAYFTNTLKFLPRQTDEFKDAFAKDVIGFLATSENLADNDFVAYIQALAQRFPHNRITAFYFTEQELRHAQKTFENDPIEFLFLDSPEILAKNIEVYIDGFKMAHPLRMTVNDFLLRHCQNIYIVTYRPPSLPEFVSGFNTLVNAEQQKVLGHLARFDYTQKLAEENSFNVYKMHQNSIRSQLHEPPIEDNDSVYETSFFNSVELALKYPAFKYHFNKIRTLMQQLS